MTVEELKEKVDRLKQLNKELREAVGVYVYSDMRGFFQANVATIAKYAKEHGLETEIKPRKCDTYPWEITVPEIKLNGVASDEEVQEIKALIEEKAGKRGKVKWTNK
ncbi:MAG: hypothetical protein M0P14_02630 [Alkaliphilus sp.]|nr:hypothetical protein [Alkaliphilus sp.]